MMNTEYVSDRLTELGYRPAHISANDSAAVIPFTRNGVVRVIDGQSKQLWSTVCLHDGVDADERIEQAIKQFEAAALA